MSKTMLIPIYVIYLLIVQWVYSITGQLESPCSDILKYESHNNTENDRWYANLFVRTSDNLNGVWLRIELDRKADLLGNWFGDATSKDNKEYIIRNPTYILEAGPPIKIRFFVKYNAGSIIPTVKRIVLNGKVICPINADKNFNQLHISHLSVETTSSSSSSINKSEESRPYNNSGLINNGTPLKSQRNNNNNNDDADDDVSVFSYFPGDIAFNKTTSRPDSISSIDILKPSCGIVATKASPLISYGQRTIPGQWPWHASIYHLKDYICGGTLISKDFVLTAAHCVTQPRTNQLANKERLFVYLGKYSLSTFGPEVQRKKVEKVYIHSDFNATLFYNDIALLELDSPVQLTDNVRICCLWEEDGSDIENIVGELGTVVGWGLNENKTMSNDLMQANMPIVSRLQCIFSNRNFFSNFIYEKNYCAGFRNGTSVCNGDSGGAMVFKKSKSNDDSNQVWQIRGIVSVSIALQGKWTCDPSNYVVFTDVAKHLNWIKQIASL